MEADSAALYAADADADDVPLARPLPDSGGLAGPPALLSTSTLSGRRKAAVLLVTLGPKAAAEVFSHLREDEIEELSLEMAKTRQVPREDVEAVLREVTENAMAIRRRHTSHNGKICRV